MSGSSQDSPANHISGQEKLFNRKNVDTRIFLTTFSSIHRFLRLFVNTFAHWCYKSISKPANPTISNGDVTVIVPTIENEVEELRAPLHSILACNPFELILVTTYDRYSKLQAFAKSLKDSRVKVYHSRIANKRLQLREAIPRVKTRITILVDDDVTWPETILPWLLAPLDVNPRIGAVGPCQKVRRLPAGASLATKCWNWLGCAYIERRNFEISATHFMDGGTSCMSGRTCAFRSEILQNPLFLDGFCNERWGQYHLNADDDNFVTRWIVSHGWDTYIQYNNECMIETTLENNSKFLAQCLRWSRSNWRSNWTSLFVEKHVWL
jgi:cellulose synthase/poly-beta-1,6-N-acetylglucosamine synthase-like glycosyltransferase